MLDEKLYTLLLCCLPITSTGEPPFPVILYFLLFPISYLSFLTFSTPMLSLRLAVSPALSSLNRLNGRTAGPFLFMVFFSFLLLVEITFFFFVGSGRRTLLLLLLAVSIYGPTTSAFLRVLRYLIKGSAMMERADRALQRTIIKIWTIARYPIPVSSFSDIESLKRYRIKNSARISR